MPVDALAAISRKRDNVNLMDAAADRRKAIGRNHPSTSARLSCSGRGSRRARSISSGHSPVGSGSGNPTGTLALPTILNISSFIRKLQLSSL